MSERIDALKKSLTDSRTYLNTVLDHIVDRADVQIYTDGLQWDARQIVLHLADADAGHNSQAMNIAQGRDLIPEDFDIQRYNASRTRKNAERTLEEGRAALAQSRAALMQWLDEIDDETLDKKGRHASLRIMTVEEIIIWQGQHERIHARDIVKALSLDSDNLNL